MFSCRSVTVRYGDFAAVDNLNLEIPSGQVCAMLGPNGAGKSTTLKVLAGLQTPTAGAVSIDGKDPREAKQLIGVMPENLGLFEDLSVEEHLQLTAEIYGAPAARIEPLLRVLSLEKGRNTLARQCSHGMRKKTSFAMALLHNPKVLLLDEPFEAVDPVSSRAMFEILRDSKITVFLTSHILSIVERLADRFVLIRGGKLVESSTDLSQLEQRYFEIVEPPVTERLEWLGSGSS